MSGFGRWLQQLALLAFFLVLVGAALSARVIWKGSPS